MWCLQLIGKDFDLHFVSWTLKQYQIMCIQTNCARCFALLKQVLCNVDHTAFLSCPFLVNHNLIFSSSLSPNISSKMTKCDTLTSVTISSSSSGMLRMNLILDPSRSCKIL